MWRGRQLEKYEWVSDYLQARGGTRLTRFGIASTAMAMALAVVALLLGAGGPQTQPAIAMMWLAAAGGVFASALWTWRWPTRRQSIAFAAITTASVSLACLAYPQTVAALLGCVAFTTIAGYVAFFHSKRVLIATFAVIVIVAVSQAIQLAIEGRVAQAIVDLFLVLQANATVALAIHGLVRTARGDSTAADLDPLTGLLNRRAFRRQLAAQIAEHRHESRPYLLIALMDLDKFKAVNDNHGHDFGDRALQAVADVLRTIDSPTALVARSGGEEFLISDFASAPHETDSFDSLRAAIEALPIPTNASIGTACLPTETLHIRDLNAAVDSLIVAADSAMYYAKRNGGNQCRHHGALL